MDDLPYSKCIKSTNLHGTHFLQSILYFNSNIHDGTE